MKTEDEIAVKIADFLLEIKAVILRPEEPFTWASGWRSPVYCDNRLLLSYPEIRNYVESQFCYKISADFPNAEAIAGVATAGIPHAAIIANQMNFPLAYVRSKKKEHGTGSLIEGRLEKRQRVVVIEDLVSTGKSSIEAITALREADVDVLGLLSIFSYNFPVAAANFSSASVKAFSLTSFPVLIQRAVARNYIKSEMLETLEEWRDNPASWGR
ncbi:MAG: orotate phosphoribosyltransferase [Bacteroidia bacterium]